jgi:hypothetical protein
MRFQRRTSLNGFYRWLRGFFGALYPGLVTQRAWAKLSGKVFASFCRTSQTKRNRVPAALILVTGKGFVSAQSWFQDFTRVYME